MGSLGLLLQLLNLCKKTTCIQWTAAVSDWFYFYGWSIWRGSTVYLSKWTLKIFCLVFPLVLSTSETGRCVAAHHLTWPAWNRCNAPETKDTCDSCDITILNAAILFLLIFFCTTMILPLNPVRGGQCYFDPAFEALVNMRKLIKYFSLNGTSHQAHIP